jgi:hypothetical protein
MDNQRANSHKERERTCAIGVNGNAISFPVLEQEVGAADDQDEAEGGGEIVEEEAFTASGGHNEVPDEHSRADNNRSDGPNSSHQLIPPVKCPAAPCARGTRSHFTFDYAISAAPSTFKCRLEYSDRAVALAGRALFVSARKADAGPSTACALLRSIMSQGIRHPEYLAVLVFLVPLCG